MKRTMKKMVSMALTGTMAVAVLAGAGTSEVKAADKAKIGVLVADVSGEEAQGFRSYYENYIAGNYDVEFNYTDALQSAEDEKTAIEKFASQGCQAIISFSSNDRVQQIETCEKYDADMCYVWNRVYKTEFLERINLKFIEGMVFEDVDFVTRAVYFLNKNLYLHNLLNRGMKYIKTVIN